ncbi:MAG: THUMP domain-containing protein [Gemmataceae bacterium]|nr:THUMP domain-containing protein [Gemmata sp.]MDW8197004.1 THUMP domain-containing protein [Gemmataceae bacterium]
MNTAYFATCARGLEPLLARELTTLTAQQVEIGRGGVAFVGDRSLLYRSCLWLRTAIRVLQPVLKAEILSADELYDAVRSVDWAQWMTPEQTLAVDCNLRDSALTHSQYAARRVKDAICDQFRERTGRRPRVDTEHPMIALNLHVAHNHAILSLDGAWVSLHKRGYRPIQTIAPLNEALAAGLLLHTGWNGSTPLVDPLCGSGTLAIEGAWIAVNRAPGLTRKWFPFQAWPDFDRSMWNALRDEARAAVAKQLSAPIVGSDIRADVIELAQRNARAAGMGHLLQWSRCDVRAARPPCATPGLVICNPPYGERIGEEKELACLYQGIGEVARSHWPGWRWAVFTSNHRLARLIDLPIVRKTPFFNGSLECMLWEFQT